MHSRTSNEKQTSPSLALLGLAVATVLAATGTASARDVSGGTVTIGASDAVDKYKVFNNGHLIADNVTTWYITIRPSGTLTANQLSFITDSLSAVYVEGGKATITDSTLTRTGGYAALQVAVYNGGPGPGPDDGWHYTGSATVVRSDITGLAGGASLSGLLGANLTLQDSTVTGTAATASGIHMAGGTLVSQNSTITGGRVGLHLINDSFTSIYLKQSDITLTDNTVVKGNTGPGILVEDARGIGTPNATIRVLNGSTVTGGNGTLLEVTDNSTVNFIAGQTELTGNIQVESGSTVDTTLQAGGVLNGALFGVRNVTIDDGGRWNQTASSTVDTVTLGQGTLQLGDGTAFNTLTVNGNYTANNGNLVFHSVLGDDASASDKLVIKGDTAGNSNVQVLNVGGAGAQTVNGIQLIQVDGASNGTFALNGRAVGGLYEYFLFKGGKTDPSDGDWYLRSQLQNPTTPGDPCLADPTLPECGTPPTPPPVLRPEPGAYLANLRAAETMFRTDYHSRHAGQNHGRAWARVDGSRNSYDALNRQLNIHGNSQALHVGMDLLGNEAGSGVGVMLASGNATNTTTSNLTNYSARGKVRGTALGVYGTLRALNNDDPYAGLYLDGWVQREQFRNRVQGAGLAEERYDSKAWQGAVEAGYAFRLSGDAARGGLYLEPQVQVGYTDMDSDDHVEANGTRVQPRDAGGTFARAGLRLSGVTRWDNRAAQVQPYLQANWLRSQRNDGLQFDGEAIDNRIPTSRFEVAGGASITFAGGLGAWAGLAVQSASGYRSTSAQLGMSYSW